MEQVKQRTGIQSRISWRFRGKMGEFLSSISASVCCSCFCWQAAREALRRGGGESCYIPDWKNQTLLSRDNWFWIENAWSSSQSAHRKGNTVFLGFKCRKCPTNWLKESVVSACLQLEKNQDSTEWDIRARLYQSFTRDIQQMPAMCIITLVYEISGERGFLSNACEREFWSLEELGSGNGELGYFLKIFTWLINIMHSPAEITALHITDSLSLSSAVIKLNIFSKGLSISRWPYFLPPHSWISWISVTLYSL